MNFTSPWKIGVCLFVLASTSGLIGAGIALRVQAARAERSPLASLAVDPSVDRLAVTLALTPEQKIKIRPILERGYRDIRTITVGAVAQSAQVGQQLEQEIRPLLTAEQVQRLEHVVERRKRLRDRWQNGERLTPEQREWLRDRLDPRSPDRPGAKPKS